MVETAYQIQFRQEMINGFEQTQSLLRSTVTSEAMIKGNQATFLITDSGAEAVTRGVNGLIPSAPDNLTQKTATLTEWHRKPRVTGYNIFASQGDRMTSMRRAAMIAINKKIDEIIINDLNTGTVNTGTATTASMNLVSKAITMLGNAEVPWDGNIFAVITPAFFGYLNQMKEFNSAEIVNTKPVATGEPIWDDRPKMYEWLGVKWMMHPRLPGRGTAAEKCFMFHRSAIGHAANTQGMSTFVGYDEEDDYSFARCSIYMGGVVLQNSGIVVMNHDGSALSA